MQDIIPLAGIGMVTLLVGIPILGLTIRFALRPIAESVSLLRSGQGAATTNENVEKRLAALEDQMAEVGSGLQRLAEAVEFQARLAAPPEN
ncbi:MAG: hypothetical protein ACE5HF_08965 [Gemmatimonadota bacterium]